MTDQSGLTSTVTNLSALLTEKSLKIKDELPKLTDQTYLINPDQYSLTNPNSMILTDQSCLTDTD